MMHAEIFALGSELTTGAKLDTNSRWLSAELAGLGIETRFHHTAADDAAAMLECLRAAAVRSELVILTGGLGPTADDLTRPVLAELAGAELVLHEPSLRRVEDLYRRSGRPMPAANRAQALLPAGGEVIDNPRGTAPGVWLTVPPGPVGGDAGCTLVALPGVPAEMKPMFLDSVAPRLPRGANLIRVARVNLFGAGESGVEERLGDLTARGRTPEVGITAHEATITLRVVARGRDEAEIERQFSEAKRVAFDRVGDLIFGGGGRDPRRPRAGRPPPPRGDAGGRGRGHRRAAGGVADGRGRPRRPRVPRRGRGPDRRRPRPAAGRRGRDDAALAEAVRTRAGATYGLLTPAAGTDDDDGFPDGDGELVLAGPGGVVREPYRRAGGPDIARSRLAKAGLDLLRRRLAG